MRIMNKLCSPNTLHISTLFLHCFSSGFTVIYANLVTEQTLPKMRNECINLHAEILK